ncbi:hypothetical protein [Altibacter lentus]|uniref:hypothetical protein n=1 Tax=Altibacter lentus TaxID=1223410 RepID=UPI0005551167|nr:hypothetical protein [Altibacter lentus]
MRTTVLLLSIVIALQIGCDKADDNFVPHLPLITQTGENTFGCYIDGKILIPRDGEGTFNTPDPGMRFVGLGNPPNYEYIDIKIRDFKSGNGGLLDIHIPNLHQIGEGTFLINESNCEDSVYALDTVNIRCRWLDETSQSYKWYCSLPDSGLLIITRYDFENRIVSGTFSCRAVNRDDPTDFIEITEGRFDIKWDDLPGNFP